jgi:enamine deaminase RidA (YjgF/YER057c/UK114 family)
VPRDQYVPAVAAGGLVFVSGQDPERGGRLAYRGRVGAEVTGRQARAALRLATLNALAAAASLLGSLDGVRRCLVLGCFVDGVDGHVHPTLAAGALALLRRVFGTAPALWLRPARGLAGGMPVEVELVLELECPPLELERPPPEAGRPPRPESRSPSRSTGAAWR